MALLPVRDALTTLRELLGLQRGLLAALAAQPAAKKGEVSCEGTVWSYRRHGAGVAFVRADHVLVDVHDEPGQPEWLDAYRVMLYCQTVRAPKLSHLGVEHPVAELAHVQRLLEALREVGAVEARGHRHFCLR